MIHHRHSCCRICLCPGQKGKREAAVRARARVIVMIREIAMMARRAKSRLFKKSRRMTNERVSACLSICVIIRQFVSELPPTTATQWQTYQPYSGSTVPTWQASSVCCRACLSVSMVACHVDNDASVSKLLLMSSTSTSSTRNVYLRSNRH